MPPEPNLLSVSKLPAMREDRSVCYLIGAGFSAASMFETPTAVGFLARKFRKHTGNNVDNIVVPDRSNLGRMLNRVENAYGPLQELNLETVMTELHLRAHGIGRTWEQYDDPTRLTSPGAQLRNDYDLLLTYIRERLPDFDDRDSALCPLVARFVRLVRANDSIVTLNYDAILEHHFATEGRHNNHLDFMRAAITPAGSTYGGTTPPILRATTPESGHGIIAKLHGSKDWFTCSNPACVNARYIEPMGGWAARHFPPHTPQHGPVSCAECGFPRRAVIIPPIAGKAFSEFPKLGVLWAQAYQAFRSARRWVFMGVSLAETDFHLAAFLRSLTRLRGEAPVTSGWREICIADKKPKSVADRLLRVLGPKATAVLTQGMRGFYVTNSIKKYISAAEEANARASN